MPDRAAPGTTSSPTDRTARHRLPCRVTGISPCAGDVDQIDIAPPDPSRLREGATSRGSYASTWSSSRPGPQGAIERFRSPRRGVRGPAAAPRLRFRGPNTLICATGAR
jgi:hypothetical protein